MNAMNNFTISGFVVNDAKVKNFEKASVARFGLSFRTTEKKGDQEVKKSSILDMETWIKKDDTATIDMLKKGTLIKVEGFFKADSYTKDGKEVHKTVFAVTKIGGLRSLFPAFRGWFFFILFSLPGALWVLY